MIYIKELKNYQLQYENLKAINITLYCTQHSTKTNHEKPLVKYRYYTKQSRKVSNEIFKHTSIYTFFEAVKNENGSDSNATYIDG